MSVAPGTPHKALNAQIDRGSDRAVFRQIADHLREAIQTGVLAPGEKLPSESQMQEHYGVQKMTTRAALDLLKAEGLVQSEHGRGVFVRTRPLVRRLAADRFARKHRKAGKAAFLAEVEAIGARPSVDSISVTETATVPRVAAPLGLRARERVLVRRRRYLIDGHPVEVATSYIPASIARGTQIAEPDSGPGGIYARFEELGHRLDHFTEQIQARMPSADEARALALPGGVPVIRLVRTAFDTDGRAVEVCDTVMSSEAYVLDYQLPAR
jgi:GntR family transcriptional regulator